MELTSPWWTLVPGSPTYLRWPWLALLLGGLLVGLVTWWLLRGRRPTAALPVSHTDRLAGLARYRTLVRRRRGWVGLRLLGASLAALGCLLLAARPADVHTLADRPSRDILVCLDVSGSMRPIDAAVVRAVRRVVASLPGDRVGLTIFDGQAVVKFPLTDDRRYVADALNRAETAFEEGEASYYGAADSFERSSQLGDGLHACVHGFDRIEERRGRVVLVVSDNRPFGPPAHVLDDVARQARDRDVIVHALGAPWLANRPVNAAELRRTTETTGGSLVLLDDGAAVPQVVEQIDKVEQRRLATPPRSSLQDRPQAGVALVVTGGILLSLLWFRRNP